MEPQSFLALPWLWLGTGLKGSALHLFLPVCRMTLEGRATKRTNKQDRVLGIRGGKWFELEDWNEEGFLDE